MQKKCFVPCCLNTSSNSVKKFITVPRDDRRQAWFDAVNKSVVGTNVVCCEDHFNFQSDAENWAQHITMGSKLLLKKNVVPHLKLKRSASDNIYSQAKKNSIEEMPSTSTGRRGQLEDITNLEDPVPTIFSPPTSSLISPSSKSSCSPSKYTFEYTSSDTYDEFEMPVNRQATTVWLLEKKSRFYLGIPEEVYHVVKYVTEVEKITYLDTLIALKKIRTNDVNCRLGDDFQMSESYVQKAFLKAVPLIANCMQELIIWPESKIIKRNLPVPFMARYSNVQSIIDCFEIEIEKPSDPVQQAKTWSTYKSCNTIKILISATPNGLVQFLSGGYGGRASDKFIIENSGYLDMLPTNAGVMADRGFKHIDAVLQQKVCFLVRPPSVPEGTILLKSEVKESKRIASLQIHIERVIKRIRDFKMIDIHSRINSNLLFLINHIVIIACGIINVQGPIIK